MRSDQKSRRESQLSVAKAARCLGVTRTTMREKLACFGRRPAGEPSEQP